MAIIKWNELQLKFELEGFDETEKDAEERAIQPDEARLISESARAALEAQTGKFFGKSPEWMKDYLMLRGQGWPWRVAVYIAWAASPRLRRTPETLGELATEMLGLKSPRVIYEWRRKYASIETVVSMMQARPLWEHRADVYEALVNMATTANYKSHNDRKLFLEMIGDYVPRSVMGLGKVSVGNDLSEISDDELRRLAGEVDDRLKFVDDEPPIVNDKQTTVLDSTENEDAGE